MNEPDSVKEFIQMVSAMSSLDRERLFETLTAILQERIEDLDETWQDMSFFSDGNFSLDQAKLGVFEAAVKKRTYFELIDFLNSLIHPEPSEEETEGSPEDEEG